MISVLLFILLLFSLCGYVTSTQIKNIRLGNISTLRILLIIISILLVFWGCDVLLDYVVFKTKVM